MKKPTAPCKDCKDRAPACHGECSKYKDYEKDYAEYLDWLHVQKRADYVPRNLNTRGRKHG